jgi:hypothetical protein
VPCQFDRSTCPHTRFKNELIDFSPVTLPSRTDSGHLVSKHRTANSLNGACGLSGYRNSVRSRKVQPKCDYLEQTSPLTTSQCPFSSRITTSWLCPDLKIARLGDALTSRQPELGKPFEVGLTRGMGGELEIEPLARK